jgi:gamma-glutamylcyclotransferase (GGCT)/AIG2-like uncharacterized protein YtfP
MLPGSSLRYFAYGSNMDPEQIAARAPGARLVSPARLRGYRLAFTRRGSNSDAGVDVVADAGREAWGVLYKITPDDLTAIDKFEGVPTAYKRLELAVEVGDDQQTVRAWVYVVTVPDLKADLRPRRAYLQRMLAGARARGLPSTWLAHLAAIKTAD